MTAYESFYAFAAEGVLPTAVPVMSPDGTQTGLCSGAVEFMGLPEAEGIVLSNDPRERAVAALYGLWQTAVRAHQSGAVVRA